MNLYLAISGIIFTVLWLIWTTRTTGNVLAKTLMFIMAAWSTFLNLEVLGYIVKL